MDKEQSVIGIDLGGTGIKLGKFCADGTCLDLLRIHTPQPATPSSVFKAMLMGLEQLKLEKDCKAIGVGTPGPADITGKIAKIAINLPGWHNVPLAHWLEKETGLPTILENDANCATLGEAWRGAGRQFKNFILLTLGTGVGGGIILNGELFRGYGGAAGELGLITLNPDGPPCNSGNRGSLEQYASARAIQRMTGKEPLELAQLAQKGDQEVLAFWEEYGRLLGAGLTSLIYVLTPEAVIIGGGIGGAYEFFLPATLAEINRRVLAPSRENLQLLRAELGNNAGMLGAALLAWRMMYPGSKAT